MSLAHEVIELCRSAGFARAGVTDAHPSDQHEYLRDWLAEGRHGAMEWLARHAEQRLDAAHVVPGARSIIMVADVYSGGAGGRDAPTDRGGPPVPRGKVARYARGEDYHDVMKKRLHALCDTLRARFPAEQFRAFVDTAPVMEREHAARAGLGWLGKNTLLIHPDIGSWMLLGGIITTLHIEPPPEQTPVPDHCGTCTRCIDACPTRALTPYKMDARRCISYLTIEHRAPIDPEFHEPIGDWLFGCDICQEVCPHNRERSESVPANPAYGAKQSGFDLLEVLGWTEETRRSALSGSSMKRAKLDLWKRNALIVAANALRENSGASHSAALSERIKQIATDAGEPEMVRETAQRVVAEW